MKLDDVIKIHEEIGASLIQFEVLDTVFFDGLYCHTHKPKEGDTYPETQISDVINWFPAVILSSTNYDNMYCYPVNIIKHALDMIGANYDSHKEIFQT